MANTTTKPVVDMLDGEEISFKRPNQAKEIIRRLKKNKGAMIGLFILILIALIVIFADVIASYEVGVVQVPDNKLAPMSSEHPLGCDSYGRDVLSRLVHGARNSLLVAIAASISSCLVGYTLGAIAGYFGGKIDQLIMRALDIFMSIPDLLFTMVVVASLGSSITVLIIAMTLAYFTNYVRLVRSGVLNLVDQEYIEAARAGEAGRGFAVVADEVRKLAEKTMTATTEVGSAVTAIQNSARKNVEAVDNAVRQIEQATEFANSSRAALEDIVGNADTTADQVRAIATASEEQSAASEEINRAILEVNDIAGLTVQSMHEAAQAVDRVSGQAHALSQLVEELKRA